jgi:hypothetical protein
VRSFRECYPCANHRPTWRFSKRGAVEQSQKLLLSLGREQFGEPTPEQAEKLKKIQNLEELERLAVRLLRVKSWDDLLKGR